MPPSKARRPRCRSAEPFQHGEETIFPRSRTFFFRHTGDNPHYDETYLAVLQSMPEPERSRLLYGNFAAEATADPWQVIPTAWVKLAQQRWLKEKPDMPLSGVGSIWCAGTAKTTWRRRNVTAPGSRKSKDARRQRRRRLWLGRLLAQSLEGEAHRLYPYGRDRRRFVGVR